jgi:SAM-dependent methyltransferase
MTTPYDTVSYPGRAYEDTHPDRLATLAALYGMDPAPIARCRLLELGCSHGGNIIPMAYQYPDSHFTGIDLSQVEIERGMKEITALGLKNIELRHCSIMDVTPDYGCFDYIITHGVYAWVPPAVREKIMAIFAECLAPQGVAYVSYNSHPGSHLRNAARDAMLFHVRTISDPKQRVAQARAILNFLADVSDKETAHGVLLRGELQRIGQMGDEVLYHDDLDAGSTAFLLHEVVATARIHHLQYLCDAKMSRRDLSHYSDAVKKVLGQFPDNEFMERDQYQDFIDGHGFRRTLLCRSDIRLNRSPDANSMKSFCFASSAKPVGDITLRDASTAEFKTPKGDTLATPHPLSKAAIAHLGECWPATVGFADLSMAAQGLLAVPDSASNPPSADDIERLAGVLLRLASSGLIELHRYPPRLTATISDRPVASLIARRQAESKMPLTNLLQRTVVLGDEIAQLFLILVDGTRDVDALVTDLNDTLTRVGISTKDTPVTPTTVADKLRALAGLALLIG